MGSSSWKVGDLARRTGLTVRTLHHYDQIGLLTPSARTPAGHRVYDAADVARLYRVRALRELGLPLDVIGPLLDGTPELVTLLVEHLAHVEAQQRALRTVRDRLAGLVHAVQHTREPTTADLLTLIEEMTTMEQMFQKYYTSEQREQLAKRREELGDQAIADVQAQWPDLIAAFQAEADAGTDPADPKVQALARRWMELLELFHGGDPGLKDSLYRMHAENSAQLARQGGPSAELVDYVRRANQSAQG